MSHPRHCICTHTSRGLSAIAEFLVIFAAIDELPLQKYNFCLIDVLLLLSIRLC